VSREGGGKAAAADDWTLSQVCVAWLTAGEAKLAGGDKILSTQCKLLQLALPTLHVTR
jgi:hypothetical protein